MAQQAMQHRHAARAAEPAAASAAGPVQARLAQLAATLNGAAAVQRAGAMKKKLSQRAVDKKKLQRAVDKKKLQRREMLDPPPAAQMVANKTGLPNQLKSGVEALSGMSMDHVRVHYDSPKPAQLNAHA